VSLTQLVKTMHNICKVWGSNPDHHQKKRRRVWSFFFCFCDEWI